MSNIRQARRIQVGLRKLLVIGKVGDRIRRWRFPALASFPATLIR
jgi:hypothetical protein